MAKVIKKVGNIIKVYCAWTDINCDPVQYKPSSPRFAPQGVRVSIDVPNTEEYVEEYNSPDDVVLTLKGMMFCTNTLRNGIAAYYNTSG